MCERERCERGDKGGMPRVREGAQVQVQRGWGNVTMPQVNLSLMSLF